jgi:predicted porin
MKKHLIAAAVAAAIAVPAAAQVTVYGVIDTSYGSANKTAAGTVQSVNSSVWATNRLGFRGQEDLGGGLKAGFVIESRFLSDVGEPNPALSSSAANTFGFAARGAEVFLAGGFGQVRLGKAVGSDINTLSSGIFNNVGNSGGTTTATRPANRVQYITPSFNGLTANLAMATNANDAEETTAADTKETGKYSSIGFSYTKGALTALVAQAKQDLVASSATTKNEDTGILVRYNFGMADLGLRYYTGETTNAAGAKTVDRKITAIDARLPLGGALALVGTYWELDDEMAANVDTKRYSVGIDYALSKRTAVYGLYGKSDNRAGTAGAEKALGTQAPVAGTDQTAVAVGIRHSF